MTDIQLSVTTDYALRITLYLLKHKRIIRSTELSEELHIPKTYVLKVTKKLEGAGIVKSYQGVNGGIEVLKDAGDIAMWDIIRATESTIMINRCLENNQSCYGYGSDECSVKKIYVFLQKAIEERLQAISLKDILTNVKAEEIFSRGLNVDKCSGSEE